MAVAVAGEEVAVGLVEDLVQKSKPAKAEILQRFFKTLPGQYGHGDQFIGVVVPDIRATIRTYYHLSPFELKPLFCHKYHEVRLAAFLILVYQYQHSNPKKQIEIYKIYLRSRAGINNWDLVDLTAPHILGAHTFCHHTTHPLDQLAKSKSLWDKRLAIIATFYHLRQGSSQATLRIVEKLLLDPHDLIQKANGWMLRELGKLVSEPQLINFIAKHYNQMPRTTLRYAIERFSPQVRKSLLSSAPSPVEL